MQTRDTSRQARTASGINVLLGIWLILSPWVYGYATGASAAATWNSVVLGVLVIICAANRWGAPRSSPGFSWANVVFGIWAIISPWVYGLSGDLAAMWNSVIAGILIALLAIWSGGITVSNLSHSGQLQT